MDLRVPTEKDWEKYRDNRDISEAYENFAGKTNDEMQNAFKMDVVNRSENISWMPLIPFQYYILGLKQHIDSKDFTELGKPNAAHCFIEIAERKIKKQPHFIEPILAKLKPTLNYIAENQDYFDADIDIYGDFRKRVKNLLNN